MRKTGIRFLQTRRMCNSQLIVPQSATINEYSRNYPISSSVKLGHALSLYHKVQENDVQLSDRTYVPLLKACTALNDFNSGCQIHVNLVRKGLLYENMYISNSLIDMYVKCGSFSRAQEVFCMLPAHDVVTWTALIGGYTELKIVDEALRFLQHMLVEGIIPNAATLVCSLKACGSLGLVGKGKELHAAISGGELLQGDALVGNALLDFYVKCGLPAMAQEVFDMMTVKDTITWNSLLCGCTQQHDTFCHVFEQMHSEGTCPNIVTYICSLNACGAMGDSWKGTQLHAVIVSQGLLESDVALGNALVGMYAKWGWLARAWQVFNIIRIRDVITWTTLITAYVHLDLSQEALNLLEWMQLEDVTPNAVTFACCLKACGSIGAVKKGEDLHYQISKRCLLGRDPLVGNALIDMYMKCGLLAKAQGVFDKLQDRDVVSWNSLIMGYVQHDCCQEALWHFKQMQHDKVSPNEVTLISGLNACGSIGVIEVGREIHDEIIRKGLFNGHPMVFTALFDMYARCGLLAKAQEVFDELPAKDLVSWNLLIKSYAQLGDFESIVWVIEGMGIEGKKPDSASCLNVLHACSHAGLVDEGEWLFKAMNEVFCLSPSVEHHICMLDLLSRAGQLHKVVTVLYRIPFHPNSVMLLIVLGACRKWGSLELGAHAFEEVLQVDEKEAAAYLCMYNMCKESESHEALSLCKESESHEVLDAQAFGKL